VGLVLWHGAGQIAVNATWTVVGRVQTGTGDRFVAVHQVFTLTEGVQEHGHGTHVQRMRTHGHQVVQDAGDLVKHDADVLSTQRNLNPDQTFHSHTVGVF